ncbi:hypothetical protein M404DRAFT_1002582 [Pisolithus tinctorius Marx 270]|uniref:Uncharacterized protein n=1 Tax=Pisolithus tinctorius Marx 270 TaxID=870435 RepID=A0A0C3NMN8_PISTI|nr:hypothetical protein M404DRAFT_1002582 [Pisolithus tinctorius Marx 270]
MSSLRLRLAFEGKGENGESYQWSFTVFRELSDVCLPIVLMNAASQSSRSENLTNVNRLYTYNDQQFEHPLNFG